MTEDLAWFCLFLPFIILCDDCNAIDLFSFSFLFFSYIGLAFVLEDTLSAQARVLHFLRELYAIYTHIIDLSTVKVLLYNVRMALTSLQSTSLQFTQFT